jgi:hypothetical protein
MNDERDLSAEISFWASGTGVDDLLSGMNGNSHSPNSLLLEGLSPYDSHWFAEA